MAKKKLFPKVVYVKFEEEGSANEFLRAEEESSMYAEVNGAVRVAKYQLVEIAEVRADSTYSRRS